MTFNRQIVINACLFQAGWWSCVLLASQWALLVVAVVLAVHLRFSYRGEWQFIAQVTVIGWLFDSLLFRSGVLGHEQLFPPIWLSCLWPIFAISICHSLAFTLRHMVLAALFAAIGGPASYYAGANLAGVPTITPVWQFLLILSVSWALLYPLLVFIAKSRIAGLDEADKLPAVLFK